MNIEKFINTQTGISAIILVIGYLAYGHLDQQIEKLEAKNDHLQEYIFDSNKNREEKFAKVIESNTTILMQVRDELIQLRNR